MVVGRETMLILADADLQTSEVMQAALPAVREAVELHRRGALVAPPRHEVSFGPGSLVFTIGGTELAPGFRVYETFPGSRQDQLVAVWDGTSGSLQGLIVGQRLGAIRTGALGGLAVDLLAHPDAGSCAVIGSGLQAQTQLLAAAAVRPLSSITVYSRSPGRRQGFADTMAATLGLAIDTCCSAREAVDKAEIVLCATDSATPVLSEEWVQPGAHVNTVGPKWAGYHELPLDLVERAAVVATDATRQIADQGHRHFLADSPARHRIIDLGAIANGRPDRNTGDVSVYLSAGLAGTEVLVAQALLDQRP
jgi:ornithine cyclodeaminase